MTPARPELAALAYVAIRGPETPGALARAGECLFVKSSTSAGFVSVQWEQERAWIAGAAGRGGILVQGLQAIETEARRRGLKAVAFGTWRRGVVRMATSLGYQITGTDRGGWNMEKRI